MFYIQYLTYLAREGFHIICQMISHDVEGLRTLSCTIKEVVPHIPGWFVRPKALVLLWLVRSSKMPRRWLVSFIISVAIACASEAKYSGKLAWLPSLRLFRRHSEEAISAFMKEIADSPFNHDDPGITAKHPLMTSPSRPQVPNGMKPLSRRQLLGTGRKVYDRAVQIGLRESQMVNRATWIKLLVPQPNARRWKEGMPVVTLAKSYGIIWSANPCRLVHVHWNRVIPPDMGKGKYSSFGFSTVRGHLIAGEERFSVEWRAEDSTVWLDLYSVSRGSGVLGKVAMPLVRGIQKAFFATLSRQMLELVSEA